ncbi:right-handed parallel beta-helix repeat-containing protein [Streptomyces sp. NBC_01077]|uniref:right-handed parallel beta-helix repeat-containing protein n=1 Tax=Streptomyces sp. NBC_01077 TaxID=2903746 RepID=UPI00386891F3|nr:right-handed parallel beta-helix repeat-containing protein [Streptomyces sp. NBC_01077]
MRYVVSPRGGRRAHRDITSALRAAAERNRPAVIEITSGHYEESLVVRGDVRLIATDGPGSVTVSGRSRILQTFGTVHVDGLHLVGEGLEVVGCGSGTLTLEHTWIRARAGADRAVGPAVFARPHTSVTLRDSNVAHGRVLFDGSQGLVERCRFTDAANNAIAAIGGARVVVRGSRVEGSRVHGLLVSDAHAEISDSGLTGTGSAALAADARAELTVRSCTITDVHGEGILFAEQSRGTVDGTHVTGARHGISVTSGADPLVRHSRFAACRDTGVYVRETGRGRFQDCDILDAGNVAVYSTKGGTPEVLRGRIAGGNVGIAVTEGARGRFGHVRIEDLTGVALRVFDESGAVFEHLRVERCQAGLEVRGNGGTTADLTDTAFHDFGLATLAVAGEARVTARNVTGERGVIGFSAGEQAQLILNDCAATGTSTGGVVAFGQARLVARRLRVTGSDGIGLTGSGSASVDIADSDFAACALAGATFTEECTGRLVNCSVTDSKGRGVVHNGLVDLVSLRTSLPVVRQAEQPAEPAPAPVIVNGLLIQGDVHGGQFAWQNDRVEQHQHRQTEGEEPSP